MVCHVNWVSKVILAPALSWHLREFNEPAACSHHYAALDLAQKLTVGLQEVNM
jgi:hypothetical protein